MSAKSANDLWGDYLFLTKEMGKFIARQDFELFFELTEQRERLQVMIDQTDDDVFKRTDQGRQVAAEIRRQNQVITNRLRSLLNSAKQEHTVNQAYDPYGAAGQVGRRMDEQS